MISVPLFTLIHSFIHSFISIRCHSIRLHQCESAAKKCVRMRMSGGVDVTVANVDCSTSAILFTIVNFHRLYQITRKCRFNFKWIIHFGWWRWICAVDGWQKRKFWNHEQQVFPLCLSWKGCLFPFSVGSISIHWIHDLCKSDVVLSIFSSKNGEVGTAVNSRWWWKFHQTKTKTTKKKKLRFFFFFFFGS